jgi:multiple sugar transport system permease protein
MRLQRQIGWQGWISGHSRKSLATLLLAVFGALMAFPFFWMLRTSLLREVDAVVFPPIWLPSYLDLGGYFGVFTVQPFGRYILNSAFVAITVMAAQLVTASLGAYAFARLQFPGRDKLFLLYLATMLIPAEVTIVPTFVLVSRVHLVDSLAGLIIPGLFSVFITFLLRQFFLTIPFELEDAAKMDGAGYFRRYAQIVLPLSQPALATAAIFIFIGTWRNFLWPLIIIRTRELRTVPIGLAAIQQEQGHTDVPQLMAGSVMAIVPVIVVFLFLQRYYIEGVAMSGIKG